MRIYVFLTPEVHFHPTLFARVLQKHRDWFVGAALFPHVKSQTAAAALRKAWLIDGLRTLWRAPQLLYQRRMVAEGPFLVHHIALDYFENPNQPECIDRLRELEVDVVWNNQPRILREPVLSAPSLCCLNRHTSLLPAYRGVEPVFHALLNGEKELGVTYHSMTADVDNGSVYAQRAFPAGRSVWECYNAAFEASVDLFGEAVGNIRLGRPLFEIKPGEGSRFGPPTREEMRRFRAVGFSYL